MRTVPLTSLSGWVQYPAFSPDAEKIAFIWNGENPSLPLGGGEEHHVTDALHKGFWAHFAVTDAGIYLLNSEASAKPTIMLYSFQTRLLTPVLQVEEDPVPWMANLAASRDGRTVFFAQGNWHNSLTMAENFQ